MGFDTDISDGVIKMRAATILREILRLCQRTKTPLKHVYTKSRYGNLSGIPYSENQEQFSRAARNKGWVDKILLHLSVEKEKNKMAVAQYLSKCLFEKFEFEDIFAASRCGLPIRTSMNPESISSVVDDVNIKMTSLRIIYNYIRDAFRKHDILPEEAV